MPLPHEPLAGLELREHEHRLRQLLLEVLDLADRYSRDSSPAMRARDVATREIVDCLKVLVSLATASLDLEHLDLDVDGGGRRGSYGPVPWVRIFSRRWAPTAQEGFYLVYLFATDGSRVYLSLMQGTSEFRAGKRRPAMDRHLIASRSAEARTSLRSMAGASVDAANIDMVDLAAGELTSVGSESRRRIHNYEAGTVLARCYNSRQLPSGEGLFQDLIEMLPLLAHLYREPVALDLSRLADPAERAPQDVVNRAGQGVARLRQGRLLDPVIRKAIEVRAEDLAEADLRKWGWEVNRVGAYNRGYDLDCRHPDGRTLHVEVKGTQSRGEEVVLTPNEVRHTQGVTRCHAEHALYIASEIRIRHDNGVIASEGVGRWLRPWVIRPDDLVPTEYAYRPSGPS
ncbi:MrcB family domain-containing protein [Micromonospora sp. SL4-19]|uniref:MrcB family domain-containing protein n=1 Tax=Micromonospora sp. SL4-19 TaxID=3399129 RepID=UPI003A4DBABE